MGFAFFVSIMVLSLLLMPIFSQQPNTDEFFVSAFFKEMGIISSQDFNFSAPVCSWQGVFCDGQHVYVIGLVASGLGLSGVIPDLTIGKLSKLQSLDLSGNKITSLSSDFWSLGKTLKSLNLSNNEICGILPNNIGNFALLESLDLSSNSLSGNIPASFSSLLSLQNLKLDHNKFVGSIPNGILSCQSLVSIDVSSNCLNGTLPDGFSEAFPKLKALNLAGNEIHGKSSLFSGLKSISYLNISGNSFRGSVMNLFQKRLEVIDLSQNYLQGHLSQAYIKSKFNWSSLVFLDISSNQLGGELFHDLNEAQNLKHLNLAFNRFYEHKFPRIEQLSSLEYLNLSSTGLTGEIPREISKLGRLSTLDLSQNHLGGHIPYLDVENLDILDLSLNNLTGEVSVSLIQTLTQMERFNFSYNNLTFCASELSPEAFSTVFIGSQNTCPFAANPKHLNMKNRKQVGLKLSLAITISTVCFLVGLLCVAFGCRRKTGTWVAKQPSSKEEQNISGPFSFRTVSTTWVADVKLATSVPVVMFEKPLLSITFADLLSATSHFDRGTLLAEGRFGPVYRGFLPGGVHVALKVLVHVSAMTDEEVGRELEYLGHIKHPNLVPLIGYCLAGDQRIAIYEYMENGNLQSSLHDLSPGVQTAEEFITDTREDAKSKGLQSLSFEGLLTTWKFRHKIALGTARALAFLHHGSSPSIIHRDVKASSIYLDSHLEPRLADFGLVSGAEDDNSHGSPGYVPPEFFDPNTNSLTPKSDVYGFGVVLFELVTGKKPVGDDYSDEGESNLVTWVRRLVKDKQGALAIDPNIRGSGSEIQMEEALRIGYLCTADLPMKRPSMHQIVGLLKDIEPVADY